MTTTEPPANAQPYTCPHRTPRAELIAELRRLRTRIAKQDVEIFELERELIPLLKSTAWAIAELREQIEQKPQPGDAGQIGEHGH
jgi:hypothetical protein